ncbi:P-type conjugative transfer ATPase TrbB [Desulfovibrio aminophilus]|uniref:P-type conjugative transfer ATPase TrbB n=1 Tax=Desulfovibrio aminophilus TaxID=81425 RepID=UPI003396BB86
MFMRPCDDPRLLEGLRHACGPLFMEALEDPEVVEIMLNPDGSLWIERYGRNHERVGEVPLEQGRLILSQVASGLGLTVNERSPIVEGEFPLDGSRFEGAFMPIVGPGPSFSLRKRAGRVFSLEEYVAAGSLVPEAVTIIEDAVRRRLNIVVVGGTSSGKTTFVNAVIEAIYRLTPSHRLLVLEDTAELQSKSPNAVFFRTSVLAGVDMHTLAKVSMRYAPQRILVGEVRDSAALELLKLWNTGHPGGVGTFHADSAEEALPRLEELVEEAGLGPKQKLIGRAVDLAVYMEKTPDNQRRIASIIKVNGFNQRTETYETDTLYSVSPA